MGKESKMIVTKELAIDGKEVFFLEPENKEDVKVIKTGVDSGAISDRNAFSDWKDMNYVILEKAKPYTRVRRGRMEHVSGYHVGFTGNVQVGRSTRGGYPVTERVTFGGWSRVYHTPLGDVETGKMKPVNRGASSYWYVINPDGKEHRFKIGAGVDQEVRMAKHLAKFGIDDPNPGAAVRSLEA
jgi:hypothetical protein